MYNREWNSSFSTHQNFILHKVIKTEIVRMGKHWNQFKQNRYFCMGTLLLNFSGKFCLMMDPVYVRVLLPFHLSSSLGCNQFHSDQRFQQPRRRKSISQLQTYKAGQKLDNKLIEWMIASISNIHPGKQARKQHQWEWRWR